MIQANDLPVGARWALKTSYFFFGFEALMVNEFRGKADASGHVWGDDVLRGMDMLDGNKWIDLASLAGFFLGFRLVALLQLHFAHGERR